jgi:hypothetical protein
MRLNRSLVLISAVVFAAGPAEAQVRTDRWSLELFGGTALSLDTPLIVSQATQPEITMRAEWDTRPFYAAPYYAYRIAKMDSTGRSGWAFDFTHHKIYLANRPPEIQKFEISHGYNLLVLSRLWPRHGWIWSAGGGMVIGHAENTVRGLTHDDDDGGTLGGGYYLCGIVIQGGLGRRFDITDEFFVTALTKVSAANCRVPVRDGWAEAPNLAGHLNLGFGVRW